jgi:SP family arabinose:H+ symporter-like MFS transporter
VCFVAALGGLLFGYDTAVVSGTEKLLKEQYDLSSWMIGWVVSSALVGCLMGAGVGGWLSDRFGRKRILLLSALLFVVTGLGCAGAPNPHVIALARWIGGLGVGVASMVAPLYIAEISPPRLRGRMVSFYQLAIASGILVAYFANAALQSVHDSEIAAVAAGAPSPGGFYGRVIVDELWRGMFLTLVLPAGAFFILLFGVPESPRFLVKQGDEARALSVLARVAGRAEAERDLAEIQQAVAGESEALGEELWHPGTRRALGLAVFLACAGQLTGINAIIYFGPQVFAKAGFADNSALNSQVVLGVVNVVFTFLAIWKVDTMGRRPLLALGTLGVFVSLVMIGAFFAAGAIDASQSTAAGYLLVFFIGSFLACFAFSLGPLPWVFMSEVFPTRIRGRAMSIATLCLWLTNTLVCQTFPVLRDSPSIGPSLTFWLYAALVTPVFVFVWKFMPETKGRSLEELEKAFAENRA